MQAIKILLIDNSDSIKTLFGKKLKEIDSLKFEITLCDFKVALNNADIFKQNWDVIFLGTSGTKANIVAITKSIRKHVKATPILLLSQQSEASVPLSIKKAGVDDVLNIADINTPLFLWIFMSTLEQINVKKKAIELDNIQNHLKNISERLAVLIHEINNPIGIIKLAMYQLENPALPENKRETFLSLINQSVVKIEEQIKKLRDMKQEFGVDTSLLSSIFSKDNISKVAEL